MNNNEMDYTPLTSEFSTCLRLITEGSTFEEIANGWDNLKNLKDPRPASEIRFAARFIVSSSIKNVSEVPRLLEYFADIVEENPFDIDFMDGKKNCYTLFLNQIIEKKHDISLFVQIIKTLNNCSISYLPNYTNLCKFSEAIVMCLALFSMPKSADKIQELKGKICEIDRCLEWVIQHNSSSSERENLQLICLDTLYKIMSNTETKDIPGGALVIILRLVEPSSIGSAVKHIINKSADDENLKKVLAVLCTWLSQWLKEDTVSRWICEFITGLEKDHRYSCLISIANTYLKTMIQRLRLPIARPHSMAVVFLMLRSTSTPKLFHSVIKDIEEIMKILDEENEPDARTCNQSIVDCTKALMMRFPDYPIYESLERTMPLAPRMDTVQTILSSPLWKEDSVIVTENYYNSGQVGLTNLGNTCYMNSVLQALAMTRQFRHEVITYNKYSMDKNIVLRELQHLFVLLSYSKRISLAPHDFLQASRPEYFTPGQQQDSSEFLCHLLDVLYEQEKSSLFKRRNGEIIVNDNSIEVQSKIDVIRENCEKVPSTFETDPSHELPHLNEEKSTIGSLVYSIFGGESNTTYQCARCDVSSHNNDKFRDLQLSFPGEMPENQQVSVQDLINYYLTPEKLTGENMYHCVKCNALCDAQRIIKILRAPAHLILTLKHFHYDPVSRLKAKLRHKVIYNETIQIPVLKDDHNDVETYRLYAAVVHSGYSMDYGHYFTLARDSKETWYKFNDSFVHKTTLDDFFRLEPPDTPYILFYERISNVMMAVSGEKPELTSLCKHVQDFVAMDAVTYDREVKTQRERKLTQRGRPQNYPSNQSVSILRQRDNSDDDNPPPSSCREAVDILPNRFLF